MEKFVSYEKCSKKKQREINNSKRNLWETNPVTKVVESKKVYKRRPKHKNKAAFDD